jgi:hypothetical protein
MALRMPDDSGLFLFTALFPDVLHQLSKLYNCNKFLNFKAVGHTMLCSSQVLGISFSVFAQ